MIHSGDTITNEVTGEFVRFVTAAVDTGGDFVVVDVRIEPGGFVAAPHVHPHQTEVFEILEGELTFRAGDDTVVAGAGETVTVTPGMAHRFWNATPERALFRCEVRPALRFEQLLETMFALANDGKTNRRGLPNAFRLAVIADAHFDDVRLPRPSAWLQRTALSVGAAIGRMLGYKATYDPTPVSPRVAHPAL
jgi:quercetin dioxygenase-like cupin family protein